MYLHLSNGEHNIHSFSDNIEPHLFLPLTEKQSLGTEDCIDAFLITKSEVSVVSFTYYIMLGSLPQL